MKHFETDVVVVGAGPAGLAVSACLNRAGIPNILLEREDCYAPLWRKRCYDRLKLHLAKQFCNLPHMAFPQNAPTFIPKAGFISYLENYVSRFGVNPRCSRNVLSAEFDVRTQRWRLVAENGVSGEHEAYVGRFLVAATGENSEGFIPEVEGLERFNGECMHSSMYRNGEEFRDKDVLVVGVGNSGLEISYDLWNHGAKTSLVCRSSVHILNKEMVFLGMFLLRFLPLTIVDTLILWLSKTWFRNTSKYGIPRPDKGPFRLKMITGRSPTIDVGAMSGIKKGEIKVYPSISRIEGNKVMFSDDRIHRFDAVIFATGYKRTLHKWLKGSENMFPTQYKENGIYFAGFGRNGLFGISQDAMNIEADISKALMEKNNNN